MNRKVAVFGTFDTKGREFSVLKEIIVHEHLEVITIDTGLTDNPYLQADYSVRDILKNEGNAMEDIQDADKRSGYLDMIARRAAGLISSLQKEGCISGAISLGGGQGTYIAGVVMRELPIGFPKVLLSTIALVESSAAQFKHLNDTVVMNSLTDIAGINSLFKKTVTEAAGAICGMARAMDRNMENKKQAVGISAWGVTTECVNRIRDFLDQMDIEPYVFHSNGEGGMILETLIRQGEISAVADITLSEISMPLAGAPVDDSPGRLENAGEKGIPQVVVPGGLDMVLARQQDIAEGGKFYGRTVYRHNPEVMFVRSNENENLKFAQAIADKLNKAKGPVKLLLPLRGLSAVDKEGEIFYRPDIDGILFDAIKNNIVNDLVEIREIPEHINSEKFAAEIISELKAVLYIPDSNVPDRRLV